ncbi:MAG: DUF1598 domain-containing protein [Mariniblastus sp.]|nr:DUF1598 domain-containing protein [Mariniblastus sp.]
MFGRNTRRFAILFAALAVIVFSQSNAFCQVGGNNGGGNGGGATGGGATGGIEIDANGVLKQRVIQGNANLLNRARFAAAQASLNKDLQKPSAFRKISLNRLETEVAKLVASGKPVPPQMQFLAGMTRITNVFFYPETKDIVIAGPAEGFFVNAQNHVVGMKSGRSTLQLQDLIVALRCFNPEGKKTSVISCSIDPTQEGLARFRDTYTRIANSGQFRPGMENQVVQMYRESLGMQQITINGVSTKTNFARVLVEADYEMKMIGIGLKRPAVKITSFIEKAKPSSVAKSSLQRWFFQPNYDCVQVNEDETAMQLVGNGVKLVGEDESVTANGQRKRTGGVNRASMAYCNSFTKMYSKLAEQSPLWGELRNVIDMSVMAAFIQEMDFYGKAEWNLGVFGDESKFAVETLESPTQVAPVANAVWKGNYFMSPIAGGVNIQPRVALNSDRMKTDEKGEIDKIKNSVELDGLADGQWWWD